MTPLTLLVSQYVNLRISFMLIDQALLFDVNPFSTYVPLLYPLKTSENLSLSDVFRGYRSGILVENGSIGLIRLTQFQRSVEFYIGTGHLTQSNDWFLC